MTDASQDITSNPGKILKTARDELKYSVEHVAHELHLRASVVTAMEEEDYDQFSSDVFLKGYFRSYCRLVHLHEERMVELLDKQLGSRKQEREDAALLEKKIKQIAMRKKVFVICSVMLIAISLVAYIYTSLLPIEPEGQIDSASIVKDKVGSVEGKTVQGKAVEDKAVEDKTVEDKTVEKNAVEDDASEVVSKPLSKPEPLVINSSADKQLEVKQTIAKKVVIKKKDVAVALAGQLTPLDTNELEPSQVFSFKATFTGDCWFKLKNGVGKTPFAALKRSGDQVSYSGPGPFNIVLGDATKATIVFQSNSVDLKPYTARNGRAQFTLGETRKNQ